MTDDVRDPSARTARKLHVISRWAFALACVSTAFVLMANENQAPHGALYGIVLLLGALLGLFAALGMLRPGADALPLASTSWAARDGERPWAAPRVTAPAAFAVVLFIPMLFGADAFPLSIVLALVLLFVSSLRRPALFVFVAASALYLPLLGKYGLWDPWETHYGEVSREILSRDDWISLWWAQDKWFWSKPILIFWSEALTWSASGLAFRPDTHAEHTEWVLRFPIYLMSMMGLFAVYGAVGRVFSKRAGVVAALVLATTPYYSMLTHQAITDMPFVSMMTVAMMLLVLGLVEDPERRVRPVRIGPWAFSMQHAVIALILMVGLPQVLYLASRNVTFIHGNVFGLFGWHRDEFMFGSAWNPDVPGNYGIHDEMPHVRTLVMEPLGQALAWLASLIAIVWMLHREKRVQQLYMFAFYAFCALAFMAKGIPGFALPGLVAFLAMAATGRFSLLLSGKLRVSAGMLVVVTLGMPWFVAMYVRHGRAFTDRILIHDHINRLTTGVHGDNGTIQYFIWQLGYGLFPWIALTPIALGYWLMDRVNHIPAEQPAALRVSTWSEQNAREQRDTLYTLGLWFATSFTLFSAMTTKFHHYIFPAVPPAAALIGLLMDRVLLGAERSFSKKQLATFASGLFAPALAVLGIAGLRGDVRGILPESVKAAERSNWVFAHPWPSALCAVLLAVAFALFVFITRMARGSDLPAEPAADGVNDTPAEQSSALGGNARTASAAISVAVIAGAMLAAFVGRDLSWSTKVGPPGGERLIHLFVYNYGRPWPEQLDYRAILTGFSCITVALTLACAWRSLRRAAALCMLGLAFTFTLWSLDLYMIDLAPHWSQDGLVDRYYAERKSSKEPLVAWQMNWKGENFYTGNRVSVFVDLDNKKLEEWIKAHKGTRSFFVLEHSRLERLKRLLAPREVTSLTTKRDCNKFILVSSPL